MLDSLLLVLNAVLLAGVIGALRRGFSEVVKGLESIDERLGQGRP
ncbi:MAG TPA: hypothetical protein VFI13_02770 [Gemmatimonadales bacterium]|nr:hypothetical protein [Gemmatimonadales bacterium]